MITDNFCRTLYAQVVAAERRVRAELARQRADRLARARLLERERGEGFQLIRLALRQAGESVRPSPIGYDIDRSQPAGAERTGEDARTTTE